MKCMKRGADGTSERLISMISNFKFTTFYNPQHIHLIACEVSTNFLIGVTGKGRNRWANCRSWKTSFKIWGHRKRFWSLCLPVGFRIAIRDGVRSNESKKFKALRDELLESQRTVFALLFSTLFSSTAKFEALISNFYAWNEATPPSRKVRQVCLYRDIAGRIAIQVRSPVKSVKAETVKAESQFFPGKSLTRQGHLLQHAVLWKDVQRNN